MSSSPAVATPPSWSGVLLPSASTPPRYPPTASEHHQHHTLHTTQHTLHTSTQPIFSLLATRRSKSTPLSERTLLPFRASACVRMYYTHTHTYTVSVCQHHVVLMWRWSVLNTVMLKCGSSCTRTHTCMCIDKDGVEGLPLWLTHAYYV